MAMATCRRAGHSSGGNAMALTRLRSLPVGRTAVKKFAVGSGAGLLPVYGGSKAIPCSTRNHSAAFTNIALHDCVGRQRGMRFE